MTRVHVVSEPTTDDRATLRDALDSGVHLSYGPEIERGTDVLVTGIPTAEQLGTVRRALVVPYAGLPAATRELLLAQRPELPVYNLHHNAAAVAEHALALLLACSRLLIPADRGFRELDWRMRYAVDPGVGLAGGTALVVGWGAIGQRLAPMLRGLAMDVLAVRRRVRTDDADFVHGVGGLAELLPRADALLLCLPSTPETKGLFDAAALGLLPARCVLVNVGRAAVLDAGALYQALRDGRLHSAGLDAWWRYPGSEAERAHFPPAGPAFWELDNVVMSPHRAGHGPHVERQRSLHLARTLGALHHGVEPENRVDVEAGY